MSFSKPEQKNKKSETVSFTCPGMEDKLSMEKYSGNPSENFIFFRTEFCSHAESCGWTEPIGVVHLQRALCGQAV